MTAPPDRNGPGRPTKSPKSPAERMRHYRERKKWGVELHQIEVTQEAKTRLIKRGWLNEVEAQDRKSVTTALENLVDCYGRGTLDPVPVAVSTSTSS